MGEWTMATLDPFRELEALRREVDRAFASAGLGPFRTGRLAFLPGRGARQYPLVNLHDDGENVYVEALAPGVRPDKFEVTVVGSTLTIAGEKPGSTDVAPERMHRTERAAGRFMRTVELPTQVEPDQVSAQYKHGLLLLTLPRAESARPRRVTVQAS
jgi:HSP20 family protein